MNIRHWNIYIKFIWQTFQKVRHTSKNCHSYKICCEKGPLQNKSSTSTFPRLCVFIMCVLPNSHQAYQRESSGQTKWGTRMAGGFTSAGAILPFSSCSRALPQSLSSSCCPHILYFGHAIHFSMPSKCCRPLQNK